MPVPPAELIAELTIETSPEGKRSPQEQFDAVREAAGATGLARESGPESMALAGDESEVLEALPEVLKAALEAGAKAVEVRVEVPTEVQQRT